MLARQAWQIDLTGTHVLEESRGPRRALRAGTQGIGSSRGTGRGIAGRRVYQHPAESADDVGMMGASGYIGGSQLLQKGRELHGLHRQLSAVDGSNDGPAREPIE